MVTTIETILILSMFVVWNTAIAVLLWNTSISELKQTLSATAEDVVDKELHYYNKKGWYDPNRNS